MLGNGEFGLAADATGLQTLNASYGGCLLSNAHWHTQPYSGVPGATGSPWEDAMTQGTWVDFNTTDARGAHRTVPYPINCGDAPVGLYGCAWLVQNPSRTDLGHFKLVVLHNR